MQIKRFIACAVLYLVVVGAIVYLFEGGSYELHLKFAIFGSDVEYALNLPVAVWMILPPAILTLFCVLHMAYHGFKFYAFKRKISHDEKFYRELGKEILLGLDTNKDFKTNFYKIPSQIARVLSPWDRYKDAKIDGEELQNVLDTVRTVKNGEVADLKKFKLPKDNPLFIKNELKDVKTREFIVYHPSWGYFAKRYDLEQIAIEVDGKEPKPAELKELIEEAKEHGVKVIFVAPQFSKKAAQTIAKESGASVVEIDQLPLDWDAELRKTAQIFAKSL